MKRWPHQTSHRSSIARDGVGASAAAAPGLKYLTAKTLAASRDHDKPALPAVALK